MGDQARLVSYFGRLTPAQRDLLVGRLSDLEASSSEADWASWAHEGQLPPPGNWETWVLMAGRGFGKTMAGAQWITARVAEGDPKLSVALVGATLEDARRVMIEGNSGLLAVAADWVREWHPSLRRLRFTTGAEATLFSGASPDMLRGPEHHYAWCDELAKWERGKDCWDMLQLGLRKGVHPRTLVTTTPRAGAVLRVIMAQPGTITTGGSTHANPHISAAYKARVEALYAGTRLGRQEIYGELLGEAGALWTVELLERSRLSFPFRLREGDPATNSPSRLPEAEPALNSPSRLREGLGEGSAASTAGSTCDTAPPPTPPASGRGEEGRAEERGRGAFTRTLIAVDPPSGDGTCGIIACARDADGIGHVLADHSVTARSPEGWADAVAAAAAAHDTREVIAESNQGGKMVKAVLLTADPDLQVRLVTARTGKSHRAEPVAHLFEAGKVLLHGRFEALEAELVGMIAGGGYQGQGTSPDRADAMVWGIGEVMKARGMRVRGL